MSGEEVWGTFSIPVYPKGIQWGSLAIALQSELFDYFEMSIEYDWSPPVIAHSIESHNSYCLSNQNSSYKFQGMLCRPPQSNCVKTDLGKGIKSVLKL